MWGTVLSPTVYICVLNQQLIKTDLYTEFLTDVALSDGELVQYVRLKLGDGACRQVVATALLLLINIVISHAIIRF